MIARFSHKSPIYQGSGGGSSRVAPEPREPIRNRDLQAIPRRIIRNRNQNQTNPLATAIAQPMPGNRYPVATVSTPRLQVARPDVYNLHKYSKSRVAKRIN